MTDNPNASLPPAERINDHSRILEALRQAVREALLNHKRAGNPVAVWQNERVVWVPADEIPVDGHDE
jgi:hypothetical protein